MKLAEHVARRVDAMHDEKKIEAREMRKIRLKLHRRARLKEVRSAMKNAGIQEPDYVAPISLSRRRELSFVNVQTIKSLQKSRSKASSPSLPIHFEMSPPKPANGEKPGALPHSMKFL